MPTYSPHMATKWLRTLSGSFFKNGSRSSSSVNCALGSAALVNGKAKALPCLGSYGGMSVCVTRGSNRDALVTSIDVHCVFEDDWKAFKDSFIELTLIFMTPDVFSQLRPRATETQVWRGMNPLKRFNRRKGAFEETGLTLETQQQELTSTGKHPHNHSTSPPSTCRHRLTVALEQSLQPPRRTPPVISMRPVTNPHLSRAPEAISTALRPRVRSATAHLPPDAVKHSLTSILKEGHMEDKRRWILPSLAKVSGAMQVALDGRRSRASLEAGLGALLTTLDLADGVPVVGVRSRFRKALCKYLYTQDEKV